MKKNRNRRSQRPNSSSRAASMCRDACARCLLLILSGAGGPRKLERKSRLGKDDQAVSPKLSGSFPEFIISVRIFQTSPCSSHEQDELMSPRHTPDLDEVEMAQRARKADLIKQMEDSKKKIQENQLQVRSCHRCSLSPPACQWSGLQSRSRALQAQEEN